MIKKLIFIIILLVSIESHAKLSVYAGLGKNFSGLGAARLGVDKWEFGIFSENTYGANKLFHLSKNYYTTLGFGVQNSELSILSGFGFNFFDFALFGLRGELYAVTTASSNIDAAGSIGVSWNF